MKTVWLVQWFKSRSPRNEFEVPIRNFAKVTDALYRGARPDAAGYRALVERLGVRRVCSMTGHFRPEDKAAALAAGVEEWRHVPFSDRETPRPERVREWLDYIRTAKASAPIYTHCMGGRHRTGVLLGVLRVADHGWTKEQALQEIQLYGWYDALGHRPLREWFLHDFDPKDYAAPGSPAVGSDLADLSKSADASGATHIAESI
ncbi:MAG: hypothetical protein H7Z38_10075 [Rubrivivax sp.]|nr:hypothetical protein [Pyrinomonadaceae bacterium]